MLTDSVQPGDATAAEQATLWDAWAPHYDAEHAERDPAPAAVFLADLAAGGPALELAVGTGRIALALAGLGVPVDGIEISPAMADRLRERARQTGVTADVRVGDMADLDTGGKQYPLIYCAFSSFYFLMTAERQQQCLTNAARALAPGGHLVIEATVPRAPGLLAGRQQLAIREMTRTHLSLSALTCDPLTQEIVFQEIRFDPDSYRMLPVVMRYMHLPELDMAARTAGLDLAARHADWHCGDFTASSTQHISVYRHADAT